jgi:hypothetical protein
MPKLKSDATNCKTNARIAKDKYCCLDFRDADMLCGLLGYEGQSGKYFLCGPNDVVRVTIDYCPWCTKPVPWKEK